VQADNGNFSEAPHDVLAAEEFAMPSVDPELHHGPVTPPEDPSGIAEPHDILAAEEFPMPASYPHAEAPLRGSQMQRWVVVVGVLVVLVVVRRRGRARRARVGG
jgi:hypothetical protein